MPRPTKLSAAQFRAATAGMPIVGITESRRQKKAVSGMLATLHTGSRGSPSSGRRNPLIETIKKDFCPTFAPGGVVIYTSAVENEFARPGATHLRSLGVELDSAAKMPDVIVHHAAKNRLLLIDAVTSAGLVNGKRRKELKDLFAGCKAGLVFVTAFETRRAMKPFLSRIAWESEVWIADDPDHMIHFNGERFLGPYPDAMPK